MFVKVPRSHPAPSRYKLIFRKPRLHPMIPALLPRFWRRYCCFVLITTLAINGCAPVNNTGSSPYVAPTIADPAVQGFMKYLSGLLERKDLLSRRTLDDGVLSIEAVLIEAGWGKAINHDAYEKVIEGVQKHLDDPNAPFFEPATPAVNPYPDGTWEHESFDKQHTSTCARDFPELAKSSPELCK